MRGSRKAEVRLRLGVALLLCCALACVAACRPAEPGVVAKAQALLQGPQVDIVALCGFTCPERGLADGNAVISGVNSVDAFFASVLAFQRGSDALSAAIEAEVLAIGADFGVSGKIGAGIAELTQTLARGPLRASAGRPECRVDAAALLDAQARCDAQLERETAVMRCAGACQIPLDNAGCSDKATLRCAQPSSARCNDQCRGVCVSQSAKAACAGECFGSCSGTCLAFDADGRCAGACDGTCDGSCSVALFDATRCDGDCQGECVADNPRGGCSDGLYAECVVPNTGETVECAGGCNGGPIAADGEPECMISAELDATLQVSCRAAGASLVAIPVAVAAPEDAATQARYLSALTNLEHRLPHLLVLAEQGERLYAVGDDLKHAAAGKELQKALNALNSGDIHTRFAQGLECAAAQLGGVELIVDMASPRLEAALGKIDELRAGLGLTSS